MKILVIPSRRNEKIFKKIKVAAYCRVSSLYEEQKSSLEHQRQHYEQLIANNPQWVYLGVYADKASGRCNQKMPQFQQMMTACRDGKIDLILVKSISRFGRNTLEILKAFAELKELNVDVYFEVENLYLSNPNAMMLLTIYASLAQDESESKSFNIRWGIRRGFEDGTSKFINRPCYGYKTNKNGELVICEEEANVVRLIFKWRAKGDSLRTISKKLKEKGVNAPRGGKTWGTETLSKLLDNEKYYGNVLLQKTFVTDYFTGKQIKNDKNLTQYYVHNSHKPIIY